MAKAQWRNKQAILRDLAKVTQGDVLVNISEVITSNRPPALNINEETEEEYLRFCSGDVTPTEGPDLHMIRDMISMMQSIDGNANDEEAYNMALEITKVTPQSSTPQSHGKSAKSSTSSENRISQTDAEELSTELEMKIKCQPKTLKAKRERNVAIASLLKVHAGVAPIGYVTPNEEASPLCDVKSPVKLLKPEDFIATTVLEEQQASLEKVDSWLKHGSVSPVTWKGPMMSADAFRFKKSQKVAPKPVEKPKPYTSPPQSRGQYVPSPYADQLYRTIIQNKESQEAAQKLREDVWQRAERQMKELEAQKQLEARIEEEIAAVVDSLKHEENSTDLVTVRLDNGVEKQIPAVLCLPQHRHKLTGACIVCERCGTQAPLETSTEDHGTTEPAKEIFDKDTSTDAKAIDLGTIEPARKILDEDINNDTSPIHFIKVKEQNRTEPAKQAVECTALELNGTFVPDFWEELLLDPPNREYEVEVTEKLK